MHEIEWRCDFFVSVLWQVLTVNVRVCISAGIVLDWNLPPAPVTSGWKVREGLLAWTLAGANSAFFKSTGMRDWRFSCRRSLARQKKEVSTWILLNWFDLNHHFRGVFPLLEHLRVHLFCFSFHVEECIIGQRTHFTPNTCANKDIQLHQYETRVFDFWPQLLLLQLTICDLRTRF